MGPQTSKVLDVRIQHALDLIHRGPSRQCTVPGLARQVGLSDSHFHRLFYRDLKVSPARYLSNLRLHEAEHLIRTTTLSIKSVCAFVGVTDHSHFVRKFKQAFGLCPTIYRAHMAGCLPARARSSSAITLEK